MKSSFIPLSLTFALCVGAVSAGEETKPGEIRIAIELGLVGIPAKAVADKVMTVRAKLKELNVAVTELNPAGSGASAEVHYESKIPAKRLGELVEILLGLGIERISLSRLAEV